MRSLTLKFAAAAALAVTPTAFAGGSFLLQTLIDNDSVLVSDNGLLEFADFDFVNNFDFLGSPPDADEIAVKVLEDGLKFTTPTISGADTLVDFNIYYSVTGLGGPIVGATMTANGAVTDGSAGVLKTMTEDGQIGVDALAVLFTDQQTTPFDSTTFEPQARIYVADDIFVVPNGGISDFTQTYSVIPSPTAALAGMALLGVVGLRRRRQD